LERALNPLPDEERKSEAVVEAVRRSACPLRAGLRIEVEIL
jgi:hypothetical protein